MRSKEAMARAKKKYDQAHCKCIGLKLHKDRDADILAKLESLENKQGWIKDVMRAEIAREQETY